MKRVVRKYKYIEVPDELSSGTKYELLNAVQGELPSGAKYESHSGRRGTRK